MITYYLNGLPITEGSDITINGFTYPYSWLEGTSPSIRASLGIEKHGDINYNTKYYWGIDNPKNLNDHEEVDLENNPIYVKVLDTESKQMVDSDVRVVTKGLKTTCLEEIKEFTKTLLAPTDYYIIRNHTEQTEIPEAVTTYRAAVITESNRLQTAISTVTTVEELIEVMNSSAWPKAE
jgi:hypothetical protein